MGEAAERAGSESLAVAAYYQGQARLYMQKGNLPGAIDALERGRSHDLGSRRSVTPSDAHGAFLAGLRLEAGDVAGAAQLAGDLSAVPGTDLSPLLFHIACRQGDLARARTLLPEVVTHVQNTGGRSGEFLHDLVTAAIAGPLRLDEIDEMAKGLDGPPGDPAYRSPVAGQLAQLGAGPAPALACYVSAAESGILPPAARGTAHVGAAHALI